MENLNTDKLMIIQVEQLEKEKKDLNARLRIMAKRIDHVERAYRKEERPLLDKDYEEQQANDRENFEAIQRARAEMAKLAHEQDLETKIRLSRMMHDSLARRKVLAAKKAEEHAKKKEIAQRKIDEEKNKRRKAILQEREEKRRREEEEERKIREAEAERARLEAGKCSETLELAPAEHRAERIAEEERQRAAEEAERAAAEAKKREEEAKAALMRKQREDERAAAAERARQQLLREEEAEARSRARAAERRPPAAPVPSRPTNGPDIWRRPTNVAAPPTPARGMAAAPTRAESPVPSAPIKIKPAGGTPSWRSREDAKAAGIAPLRPASPAPPKDEAKKDDDGFQTVPGRGQVWRRGRGRGL
jgi:translation initiation factor 3 subunit A